MLNIRIDCMCNVQLQICLKPYSCTVIEMDFYKKKKTELNHSAF